jgi:two-component system response regulator DesR
MAAADAVDAALLDLNLPGQSGWDTFERLTTADPFLAVVIITARPNQLLNAINAGVSALLEKPLDFETLLKTVRQVLAESDRRRLERMTGQREDIYYQPVTHPA